MLKLLYMHFMTIKPACQARNKTGKPAPRIGKKLVAFLYSQKT